MSLSISISDVAHAFPAYRVAFVVAEDLSIHSERPPTLDKLIAEREQVARARWNGTELSQKPGEVVYADATKVLCRRWNWRQDARSLITPETRQAIVTLQANGAGDVEAAAADLAELIGTFCGGRCRTAVLDAARQTADL